MVTHCKESYKQYQPPPVMAIPPNQSQPQPVQYVQPQYVYRQQVVPAPPQQIIAPHIPQSPASTQAQHVVQPQYVYAQAQPQAVQYGPNHIQSNQTSNLRYHPNQ